MTTTTMRPAPAASAAPAPNVWAASAAARVPGAPVSVAALAASVEAVDVADLRDIDLVEAIAAWEHVISAATARQAEIIREITTRRPGHEERFVVDEVACALTCTRAAADLKVDLAHDLDAFPALHDALLAGTLDPRRVTALTDELTTAPHDTATRILDTMLPDAGHLTSPQIRRLARRHLLAIDPDDATRRATRARANRHVTLTPAPNTMAWIRALLPAEDALAAYTVIDALAGSYDTTHSTHHDSQTDNQDGQAGGCPPGCVCSGRTVDQRRADAFTDLFTRILDTGTTPTGPLPKRHGARATLHVTIPATTLLGLDQTPAELTGYGPIPADLARQLATDATWTRILTDPTTGTLLEAGTTHHPPGTVRYRPGTHLTAHILARDVTCTFPGCRQPSYRTDLDHITPYNPDLPPETQTTTDNLQALCRHHHLAKTHTRWNATRNPATGITSWTSPAGITYHRSPIVIHLTHLNHTPPPPAPNDEPPPF